MLITPELSHKAQCVTGALVGNPVTVTVFELLAEIEVVPSELFNDAAAPKASEDPVQSVFSETQA